MECHKMGSTSFCHDKHLQGFPWQSRRTISRRIHSYHFDTAAWRSRIKPHRLIYPNLAFVGRKSSRRICSRTFCKTVSLEEESSSPPYDNYSNVNEDGPRTSPEGLLENPLGIYELKALLADSERAKLIRKLSEANQHNRFLKRQLQEKESTLVSFKSELAILEMDIQALVALAEEIAKLGIPERSRKINGKYIQSHLLSRLEAVREKLKEQIKGVDAAQSKEVTLIWCGMAESVQVMGSFDGWSQGEYLSPENTGSHTRFSTTLILRPGRYEIKFLVDGGEWHLSPEFPTVGEGLMKNNLLIVE